MQKTHPARFFLAIVLLLSLFAFASPAEARAAEINSGNSRQAAIYAKKLQVYLEFLKLMAQPADSRLAMPVLGVSTSEIADTWHSPRDGGRRIHDGQDIFAKMGTPVYSATSGIVTRINKVESGRGGIYAFIMGPGGRQYYYAHLSALSKGLSVGDKVTTNTLVGYVGNTGNARTTPPHLHFGMYTKYGAENPLPLIANRRLAVNN